MEQKLSAQQTQFVNLLATGKTIRFSAAQVGIAERTAHRWLELAHIQTALQAEKVEATKTAHEIIIEKYHEALEPAIQVVIDIAKDTLAPAPARLKAAQMIQDRLAPIQPASAQSETPQTASGRHIDLTDWNAKELATLETILRDVEKRKEDELAKQGIPTLRKVR